MILFNMQLIDLQIIHSLPLFKYNLNIVGDFTTINGLDFLDPSNLVPTSNKGFYADVSNSLISILKQATSIQYCVNMYINPMDTGIIMKIGDYFTVILKSGYVEV